MGYRIDVGICFCRKPPNDLFNDEDWEHYEMRGEHLFVSYGMAGRKWYKEGKIMEYIKTLLPENYLMIIVGDDMQHNEEEGDFYKNVFKFSLVRTFRFMKPTHESCLEKKEK